MIVIEILFDTVFCLALTEVKRRLIHSALCKLFFIGKELQRNGSIVLLIVFVNLVPRVSLSLLPRLSLERGRDRPLEMGLSKLFACLCNFC